MRRARGCRGSAQSRPGDNRVGSGSGPQPSPCPPGLAQSATARPSPAWQSAGTARGWRARALRRPLCPSDQALRHRVRNRRRIATGRRAFRPDLLKPNRDTLDTLPHEAGIAVTNIFGANVDDAAGVDDVIGRVKNAARVKTLAVFGRRELVVRAARDYRGPKCLDGLLREDRA